MSDEEYDLNVAEVEIPTFDFKRPWTVGRRTTEYAMGKMKTADGSKVEIVVNGYDERAIGYIAECIRELPRRQFNCTVLITGERRTGKSTLAQQIAKAVDPKHFMAGNITFRLEDFNSVIRNNSPADPENDYYPQVILDEAGYDLFAQSWMERLQKELVKQLQVIGARRQILYLVLPHRELLNSKVRDEPVNFWINVVAPEHKRGIAEFYRGMSNKWSIEKYWHPEFSFTFGGVNDETWTQYEIKKSSFIEEALAEKADDKPSNKQKIIRQRNILMAYARQHAGLSQEQIGEMIGLAQSSVQRALSDV